MTRIFCLTTCALALSIGATAFAASHSGEDPAMKARNQHMALYSFNLGTLGAMAKGEAEYDSDLAQAAADRLVALSGMSQAGYYPEGTSSDDSEDSRALPKLFDEMENYTKLTDELHMAAMAMAEGAGNGVEGIQANIGPLGKSCGTCHETYRKPEE